MNVFWTANTGAYRQQGVIILSWLHANPAPQLLIIHLPITHIPLHLIHPILTMPNLLVHILCLWTPVNYLLHSQLYLTHLENITLLQIVPLSRKRFHHKPKWFANLRKLVYQHTVLLLTKSIPLSHLTHVYHHRRHHLWELRIVWKQRLVLISKLYYSYFFEHDTNNLGNQLSISKIEIKEIIMSFLPWLNNNITINDIKQRLQSLFLERFNNCLCRTIKNLYLIIPPFETITHANMKVYLLIWVYKTNKIYIH